MSYLNKTAVYNKLKTQTPSKIYKVSYLLAALMMPIMFLQSFIFNIVQNPIKHFIGIFAPSYANRNYQGTVHGRFGHAIRFISFPLVAIVNTIRSIPNLFRTAVVNFNSIISRICCSVRIRILSLPAEGRKSRLAAPTP